MENHKYWQGVRFAEHAWTPNRCLEYRQQYGNLSSGGVNKKPDNENRMSEHQTAQKTVQKICTTATRLVSFRFSNTAKWTEHPAYLWHSSNCAFMPGSLMNHSYYYHIPKPDQITGERHVRVKTSKLDSLYLRTIRNGSPAAICTISFCQVLTLF